jgi:hypothetical protein
MSKKKFDVEEPLAYFSSKNLAMDSKDQAHLVDNYGAVKEAVSLKNRKSKKVIRKITKPLGRNLKVEDVDEINAELESLVWDFEDSPISKAIRYAFDEEQQSVHIDIGCSKGEVIELSLRGVNILTEPNKNASSVFFHRPEFMQEMVKPEFTDDVMSGIKKLHPYINTDQTTFFLLVGYITYLMAHPKSRGVPYPILVIQGEKGSGKSFFCNNVIRDTVDASTLDALLLPSCPKEFLVQINSMFLAVYDNLRTLTKKQSDMMCSTASKGTSIKRTLYSDDSLTALVMHCALVLNGIHDFVKESDLASRCLRIKLIPMSDDKRKPEKELKAEFKKILPEIFGSLLTLSSQIMLAEEKVTKVKYPSRMMDFSKWLAGLESVWGLSEGLLQKAYRKNVKDIMASGTEDDSLTVAMQKVIAQTKKVSRKNWKSTPSKLLETLQSHENQTYLPRGAAALTSKLRAQESSLNANGVFFKIGRDSERYIIISDHELAA